MNRGQVGVEEESLDRERVARVDQGERSLFLEVKGKHLVLEVAVRGQSGTMRWEVKAVAVESA